MTVTMESAISIPILPARDLGETREFYERLGFETRGWWPREFGGYAILRRGTIEMHFFAFKDVDPGENYAQCYWRVSDVDGLYAECREVDLPGAGIPRLDTLKDRDWGMREFAIVDPSGNLIRVGAEIRARQPSGAAR